MASHLSDTHIYLDLNIVNNDQESNDSPPELKFVETRNAPFLPGDSADYFVSVLRFSVQTGNDLPVWIPRIETGTNQMDINKTVYKVSVESGGMIRTVPLTWIPWDKNTEIPTAPMIKQDLANRYYYMHNFNHFVLMMNNALKDAWGITKSTIANEPFIDFDSDTNKFNFNADVSLVSDTARDPVKIYFNTRLYELITTFPATFMGNATDANYQLIFMNNHDINVKPIYQPSQSGKCNVVLYQAIQLFQEISTIAMWSPISSIVFTTSLLPIKATNTSPPHIFNDASSSLNSVNTLVSAGSPDLSMVLTDFVVALTENNQYRPSINYNVGAEYRLVDLYSMPNLNRIDIMVFWRAWTGQMVPLHLLPGCQATIKLLFRNRRFNESS